MPQSITRRTGLAILIAACALGAAPANADQSAEAFVAKILDEANEVFKAPDRASRDAGIERLVDSYVDMKRVAMFALGQYGRVITPEQKEIYFPLVRRYSMQIYQEALSQYNGQRLKVTGSIDRAANDIIVSSRFADVKPGEPFAETIFTWRVYRAADGKLSVVDAGADGVWLAIEQQSQFKSVIANNGGGVAGIDALIADLKRKIGSQPL
mgnify:CR=1 FL=1